MIYFRDNINICISDNVYEHLTCKQTFSQTFFSHVESCSPVPKKLFLSNFQLRVATMKGEVLERLKQRCVDICCMQEVRWSRDSTRFLKARYIGINSV